MSIRDLYEVSIRPLPTVDRLRLASLILNDIAPVAASVPVAESTEWTDEDLADLTRANLAAIESSLGEEPDA